MAIGIRTLRLARATAELRLLLLGLLCACGGAHPSVRAGRGSGARSAAAPELAYRVSLDRDLAVASVRACFPEAVPPRLVPGVSGAADQLLDVHHLRNGRPHRLSLSGKAIPLAQVAAGECVHYRIRLSGDPTPWTAPNRTPDTVLQRTGHWLWRPPRSTWHDALKGTIDLRLPPGTRASLPFPELGPGRYALSLGTLTYISRGVFGHFADVSWRQHGCDVKAAILPGLPAATRRFLLDYLKAAIDAASEVLGRFPATRLQLILVPAGPGHGRPIRFGQLARGGGASVILFVHTDADRQAFAGDWTAVHEFSHLLLPFVERDDAWLSEGMATYYQEVLRARAGLTPVREAWAKLLSGLTIGSHGSTPLSAQSRAMDRLHNYRTVYWGGATYALRVDAALRDESGGTRSLDSVLARLSQCCGASGRPQTAAQLIATLDRLSGGRVFSRTAQSHVFATPTTARAAAQRLFEDLGVRRASGQVRLRPGPLAAIRSAIMTKPERTGHTPFHP